MSTHPIAILTAMLIESVPIEQAMTHKETKVINHIRYTLGKIGDKNIVLANTGIGLINAAMVTTALINDFHPQEVIFSGVAGGINDKLNVGDVVIGKRIFNAEFGELTDKGPILSLPEFDDTDSLLSNPQDGRVMPLIFTSDIEGSFELSNPKYRVVHGTLADSDQIPNPPEQIKILQAAHVDTIAMEGVAVMQPCWFYKTKCVIVRGISNIAGLPLLPDDVVLAINHAAEVVMKMVKGK